MQPLSKESYVFSRDGCDPILSVDIGLIRAKIVNWITSDKYLVMEEKVQDITNMI